MLSRYEGIIPALEPAHAMYHVIQLAKAASKDTIILANMCGRGDKDMMTVAAALNVNLNDGEALAHST